MKYNILYLSKLHGSKSNGPTYSVPAQVRAQSNYDNVYWLNLTDVILPEWNENGLLCHNKDSIPNMKLNDLPSPFNNPDIVVFEEFYRYKPEGIVLEILKRRIPYIIVPRASMTKEAQNHKHLKKLLGNILWFKVFAKKAAGIQFLTKEEAVNSLPFGHKNGFVIPNGIEIPDEQTRISKDHLQFTYIGRIRTYQKGLERMIGALSICADNIRNSCVHFDLYGSDFHGAREKFEDMINDFRISDIVEIHDAVYGEEKSKVLCGTDFFIMTSIFEGMPMGLIEALSYGIPCIVTEGTNMAGIIEEARAGWNAGNTADSIARVIIKAISTEEQWQNMGNNARKLAENYSWEQLAEKNHRIFESIRS